MRDYTNQTGNSDGRRFGPEFHEKPDDPHDAQRLRAVEKQLRLLAAEADGDRAEAFEKLRRDAARLAFKPASELTEGER